MRSPRLAPNLTLRIRLAGLAFVATAAACELVVSPGALQDQDCGTGRKLCPVTAGGADLACVSVGSTAYGCASTSCTPCVLPNAQPICDSAGNCAILSCTESTNAEGDPIAIWYDCNGIQADGCESNTLEDPDNCGVCDHVCPTLNAAPNGVLCEHGFCKANDCLAGFSTCDGGSTTCVPPSSCGDGG
jgi:hypothetical protein